MPGNELEILSDERYKSLERIYVPELRLPIVLAYQDSETDDYHVTGLISLSGQDRLGFHSWAINASYDSGVGDPSVTLSYGNATLAPWYIQTLAAYAESEDQRDIQGVFSLSRSFWTTPVALSFIGLRREYLDETPDRLTSLFGPELAMAYFAGEGTPYGGTQRALGLSLSAAVYPKAFGSDATVGDLRAELETAFGGLPVLGKDNLELSLTGRFLPGAEPGLLEVGGFPAGSTLYRSEDPQSPTTPRQLDVGIAFAEYLRGYEDLTLRAQHVLIGNARYRYRFIIDYGWASTLYLLPSFFISQLEVEAFGAFARTDFRFNHRVAGGSAQLNITLGQFVPLGLYYQYAYRFDLPESLRELHLVGLAF